MAERAGVSKSLVSLVLRGSLDRDSLRLAVVPLPDPAQVAREQMEAWCDGVHKGLRARKGGLLVSQILTLYTTPVIYLYLERLSAWLRTRRRKQDEATPQPEAINA